MGSKQKSGHRYTFHLLANAHLDPVWLWDWREGLNEAITTCRTVLDLMDEDRELTFIRGEAAVYAHIERYDPKTFERIARQVRAGRWDIVGGTWIQPDTNLPATETLCRHFLHGIRYFREKFGRSVKTAWAADSFGHSAGLPEILVGAGIEYFAFTRPTNEVLPIREPAFWWRGPAGSEVLAYRPMIGWYGTEREEIPARLDGYLIEAGKHGLQNVGCFYGMGNHGGGATRRMLRDIRAWAEAHPDVRVVHSGLHRFFGALHDEIRQNGREFIPAHAGELNFLFRGCYSTAAKFKFPYRATESLLASAERIAAVTLDGARDAVPETAAWETLLFNSFHDILPGTSIERALDEQIAQLGGVQHFAHSLHLSALNALAERVDTSVERARGDDPTAVPLLVFNPLPREYRGFIDLEALLDYRPLAKYSDNGKTDEVPIRVRLAGKHDVPYQLIATEHSFMTQLAWRKRVLVKVTIPPMGWSVVSVGYQEGAKRVKVAGRPAAARGKNTITNGEYRISAPAGRNGISVFRSGKRLLSGEGLSVVTVEDPWGSWGPMDAGAKNVRLKEVRHQWRIVETEILDRGPLRARLFVRLKAGNSRLDLLLSLCKGRNAVDVSARLLVDERCCRIKLIFPGVGDEGTFDVPGGFAKRLSCGEVPGGRWVKSTGKWGSIGFASDAIYNFDLEDGNLGATICRVTRYANDAKQGPDVEPWRESVDCGELKFSFLLTGNLGQLERLSEEMEFPVVVQMAAPSAGPLGRSGSLAELLPSSLRLVGLKRAEDGGGIILRVQETAGRTTQPRFKWQGQRVNLGEVRKHELASWFIFRKSSGWQARRVSVVEDEVKRNL